MMSGVTNSLVVVGRGAGETLAVCFARATPMRAST